MGAIDQSLKLLLQQNPAEMTGFALGDTVRVLRPVESGLPRRGRDIDGAYYIELRGETLVAHHEFHRRHESWKELALDIGEAQIRIHRRDLVEVVTLVWDLYGKRTGEVIMERSCAFSRKLGKRRSRVDYLCVNLRALHWTKLLAEAPPVLWPLVALADGGACEEAVRAARDAIVARKTLRKSQRIDHLSVLWIIAEREQVPVELLRQYLTENELMASTLYQNLIKSRAEAKAEGVAKNCAKVIIRILTARMGSLAPTLRKRIRALKDAKMLEGWQDEALALRDAEGAERLLEKIREATLSSLTPRSAAPSCSPPAPRPPTRPTRPSRPTDRGAPGPRTHRSLHAPPA